MLTESILVIRLAICAGLIVAASATPSLGQNFRIGKVSVCRNILKDVSAACAEVPPPFGNLDRKTFQGGRVYVALLLVCEKEAVSFLSDNGFLPVNVTVWKDGERRKSDIPIGLSQDDWDTNSDAFKTLFATQGNFTWRTRFNVGLADTIEFEITDYRKNLAYVGRDPARFTLTFGN
jgi:hypothetical protein